MSTKTVTYIVILSDISMIGIAIGSSYLLQNFSSHFIANHVLLRCLSWFHFLIISILSIAIFYLRNRSFYSQKHQFSLKTNNQYLLWIIIAIISLVLAINEIIKTNQYFQDFLIFFMIIFMIILIKCFYRYEFKKFIKSFTFFKVALYFFIAMFIANNISYLFNKLSINSGIIFNYIGILEGCFKIIAEGFLIVSFYRCFRLAKFAKRKSKKHKSRLKYQKNLVMNDE